MCMLLSFCQSRSKSETIIHCGSNNDLLRRSTLLLAHVLRDLQASWKGIRVELWSEKESNSDFPIPERASLSLLRRRSSAFILRSFSSENRRGCRLLWLTAGCKQHMHGQWAFLTLKEGKRGEMLQPPGILLAGCSAVRPALLSLRDFTSYNHKSQCHRRHPIPSHRRMTRIESMVVV